MRPTALMLFAAGFGTRMGALTKSRPKPLIEVAGKALLEHALDQRKGVALSNTVVNSHYLGDQIAAHLTGRDDITISAEAPDILDTGGGLRQALPLLGSGPVFTMNTDAVWTGEGALAQLENAWDDDRMDALLLLVPRDQAVGHNGKGDFVIAADGKIRRGPGHIYTGAQIIRTDLLGTIPETAFSLNLLWDRMLEQGRMYGLEHQGGWCDVGHPGGIDLAESMLHEAKDG
ncbi:nucleotidyltransferase [Actibacterium atlanticum]|uniref:Nucleotidyltransferase n=1 Tax=Actibacterium atlanticum TaxID=1461693 RepID=A0A058ZLW2_9RHOB|nr:nucleotidyltransferase family protein [Actibacterium atlanticum]KCV82553.1 nucleotidyltransferase [Actibacterium atlanticum]